MNIWQIDKLLLFLIFFIPGFISIKIYSLLVAGEKRDFSKDLLEVVGYSSLNFAALSWLIVIINSDNFYNQHKFWYLFCIVIIIFIMPLLWPFIFLKISNWKPIAKYIVHPIQKPWDYIFGKKNSFWIIVHLKDGRKIGGRFDTDSFASSYPAEEQIYLEEVWKLDKEGAFVEPIKRSRGIVIFNKEIIAVEFFE